MRTGFSSKLIPLAIANGIFVFLAYRTLPIFFAENHHYFHAAVEKLPWFVIYY